MQKRYWEYIILSLLVILLLLVLLHDGDNLNQILDNSNQGLWVWNKEVISALLGAAVVATITFLLLKGQANNQNTVEQNKIIFEHKLGVYNDFLSILEEVVASNNVSEENEKKLQFGVATIGMHTQPDDMLTISKNLKHIILKIRTPERVDGSIWHELMEIVNVFQHSLYSTEKRDINVNMRKALRNFSSLCKDTNYEVLEFIDCMLTSYKFNTFISDQCLFIEIPIKRVTRLRYNLPSCVYVTLKIEDTNKDDTINGLIALYCKKNAEKKIDKIYSKPNHLWIPPRDVKMKELPSEHLKLGVNKIGYSRVLHFKNKNRMELQEIVCDLINFMSPIWARKGQSFLRKDKNGEIKKENPLEKEEEEYKSKKEKDNDTGTA